MKLHEIFIENIEKKWPHIKKAILNYSGATVNGVLPGLESAFMNWAHNTPSRYGLEIGTQNDGEKYNGPDLTDINKMDKAWRTFLDIHVSLYFQQTDPVAYKTNGHKTPFVNDIARWLLNGSISLPEDTETINALLERYQILKHNMGDDVPPLNMVNDPNELRAQIMTYTEKAGYNSLEEKIVSQHGQYTAYQLDEWEEAKDFLCDSGWCVADRDSFEDFDPPFWLIVKSAGGNIKRVALLHIGGEQLMDVYNNPLTPEMLHELAPILDDIYYSILKFNGKPEYPYGGDDWMSPVSTILHHMPQTTDFIHPEEIYKNIQYETQIPQPPALEKRIAENPKVLADYMNLCAGDVGYRSNELEAKMLDHIMKIYGDPKTETPVGDIATIRSNGLQLGVEKPLGVIISALVYYGRTVDEGEWEGFKDVFRWLGQTDEQKKYLLRGAATYARTQGGVNWILAGLYDIAPDWMEKFDLATLAIDRPYRGVDG